MTAEPMSFDRDPAATSGAWAELSPLVRRLIAPNGSPFTFTGTCTYVVGRGTVAVIDPGPDDAEHVERLLAHLGAETVSHVVITHTHRDHSPAARALVARTGAKLVGCRPHAASQEAGPDGGSPLDSSFDLAYAPDLVLAEGEGVSGPGWSLAAVATPGHTMNHLAFALPEEAALFSGDHVMAWSTTVVSPPHGSMAAYMASLDKLRARTGDALYWPGHGGPVRDPQRFVRALQGHRRQREAGILARLREGDRCIPEIVERLYENISPALKRAAGLSTLAHLIDLCERGLVVAEEGAPTLEASFRPA